MKVKFLFFLFAFTLLPRCIFAGDTGKLAGKVTDSQTGETLIGVTVLLEGTSNGSVTDENGLYIVNNISPGQYTVIFSSIGYQKKTVVKVQISADFTSRQDITMDPETVNLASVIVYADAPLIRKDLTSSHSSIDAGQIENLPVESIDQILSLQAGITKDNSGELHIRGGRANEIDYTINGVSTQNPFDNTRTVQISTNAVKELSVVSGTFNAEYGNALSGIVNTITKEGSSTYHTFISVNSGDFISGKSKPFYNIEKLNALNNFIAEGTFGGPIPLTDNSITFFLSTRFNDDRGYLYGIRQHTIYDSVLKNPMDADDIKISSTGDGKTVSMNWSTDFNSTGKLTYKPFSTMKINYDVVYSGSRYQSYNHNLKYTPDANPTTRTWGLLNSFELRHTITNSTFYSVKAAYNISDSKRYLFPLLDASGNAVDYYAGLGTSNYYIDQRYQPEHKINNRLTTSTFNSGGTLNSHSYQRSKTFEGKFDITSQLNNNHELKAGLQMKNHNMDFEDFDILRDTTTYLSPTILGPETSRHDLYNRKPYQFAVYVQDKMEFESIILNIGLRYDYFNSKALYGPEQNTPTANLRYADAKQSISPRLGMSFPITDKGIIHFSYGHFFQQPPYSYLFANPNFEQIAGVPTFGNANLDREKTVSYEIGLQQQLTDNVAFNITGFYKDVRDLLALQQVQVTSSFSYYKYQNQDYGNIQGITFSLTKRRTVEDGFGATLDYTFQVAEGNETDAASFFVNTASNRQTEKVPVPLAWDQQHSLNATFSVGNADDWNATVVGRLGTGLPYTPEIPGSQIFLKNNSERRPIQMTVDLLADKTFRYEDYYLTLFLKVFNLFDSLNERLVFNDTGRSTYTLDEGKGAAQETNRLAALIPGAHSATEYYIRPNYYAPPREVRFGMSLEF